METYFEELPIAITVSDLEGNILDMNQKSADVNSHGQKIIGQNLYDCHPPQAAEILRSLYREEKKNVYTIEKNGIKKLIYQVPWYRDGKFSGLMELSMEIPFEMPHYIRQPKPEA